MKVFLVSYEIPEIWEMENSDELVNNLSLDECKALETLHPDKVFCYDVKEFQELLNKGELLIDDKYLLFFQ